MVSFIDHIVEAEIKPESPGVAVAVVQNGEVIHAKGYGLANLEWNIPITPDTVFRLASVSKQFTAAAILLLAEQGKLSVDDPLTKFLPKYPMSGHTVTVHQLLNHTSGIFSYTNDPDFGTKMRRDLTPQQMADEFSREPFQFRPGTRYAYNNSGYVLLGMIIEQVSGMPYADYVEKNIFAPLGMTQSYYLNNEPIIPRRASGYHPTPDGGYVNAPFLSMLQPYAAGSLGSTVNDMVLWDKALRGNTLLSAESWQQMITPAVLEDGTAVRYGYGWGVTEYAGHRVAQHSGGIPGFNTWIARFYDDDLTIIALANLVGFPLEKIIASIARQALGIAEPQRVPVTLDAAALEKAAGTYHLDGVALPVVAQDGGLVLNIGREIHLTPMSETEFYDPNNVDLVVTFSDEQDGVYTKLAGRGAFEEFDLERMPQEAAAEGAG